MRNEYEVQPDKTPSTKHLSKQFQIHRLWVIRLHKPHSTLDILFCFVWCHGRYQSENFKTFWLLVFCFALFILFFVLFLLLSPGDRHYSPLWSFHPVRPLTENTHIHTNRSTHTPMSTNSMKTLDNQTITFDGNEGKVILIGQRSSRTNVFFCVFNKLHIW